MPMAADSRCLVRSRFVLAARRALGRNLTVERTFLIQEQKRSRIPLCLAADLEGRAILSSTTEAAAFFRNK